MTNKKVFKKNKASEGTAQADAQKRVIWDDSNMRSVYANMARVVGGREKIVLLFGMNPALNAAQAEAKIQLSDRITLNPTRRLCRIQSYHFYFFSALSVRPRCTRSNSKNQVLRT